MEKEKDIVPALYEHIENDFNSHMEKDAVVRSFLHKMETGTATQEDVAAYAERLGACASKALTGNLTESTLPNGRLYWNIATRTILPLLQKVHVMVTDAARQVQQQEDKKQQIGILPVIPEFPSDRVHDLIEKLMSILNEEEEDV